MYKAEKGCNFQQRCKTARMCDFVVAYRIGPYGSMTLSEYKTEAVIGQVFELV